MYLKSSFVFFELHVLHVTENILLKALKEYSKAEFAELEYPQYLLGFGEGRHKLDEDCNIYLLPSINVAHFPQNFRTLFLRIYL